MAESDKDEAKKPPKKCPVVTCGKPIGEFGHSCNYPGKPKPRE